jgi:hypothetical protein
VFKQIDIQLTEPICSCDEQKLSWTIILLDDKRFGLIIMCNLCKTKLEVPHKKFLATFSLDKPYPGKQTKTPEPEKEGNLIKVDFDRDGKKKE